MSQWTLTRNDRCPIRVQMLPKQRSSLCGRRDFSGTKFVVNGHKGCSTMADLAPWQDRNEDDEDDVDEDVSSPCERNVDLLAIPRSERRHSVPDSCLADDGPGGSRRREKCIENCP